MPALSAPIDGIEYSLLLIYPNSSAVLCSMGPDKAPRLPRLWIPTDVRVTAHLCNAVSTAWGLQGVVLDYLHSEIDGSRCAVVELFSEDLPASLQPVSLEHVREDDLSPRQRSSLLSLLFGKAESPLSRVGWIYEAIRWVEETSGEKISSIRQIEQFNAGGQFSLLRFPMQNGQSHWLKATGEPNIHEQPLTSFLSKLCPDHIPEVLDVKTKWNAWIARGQRTYPAFPSGDLDRLEALRYAVVAMAKIQLRSIGYHNELFAKGAFDQRPDILRSNSSALFECIREAMDRQTSTKAARIGNARLHDLRRIFDEVCDFIATLRIPPMVLHGDLNPGNMLYADGHCQFIDWCETHVGHPLVSLQHLLLLNRPENARLKTSWDAELTDCYRTVMTEFLRQNVFDRAITFMPFLAAASSLYGRGDWFDSLAFLPPQRLARIRTLARCMDRAAHELQDLGISPHSRISVGGA